MVIFKLIYRVIFYYYYYLCLFTPDKWFKEPDLKNIVKIDTVDVSRKFAILSELSDYDSRLLMSWISIFMTTWNLRDTYTVNGDKHTLITFEPPR